MAEHDISVNALSALRFGIAALCFAPAAIRGLRNKEMRLTALELGTWLFGVSHLHSARHSINWACTGLRHSIDMYC